ncbi:MAG: hypothetical protein HGA85_06065 [Nanoarchaeota archaeon]|nr:hypothetical protein [Nanoarchaeota archaeon]
MIDDSVKIHDNFQFEVKLGYNIEKDKKKTEYQVDTYFFFPKSLGINHHTYSKKDFFRDVQGFIRYKTPAYSLDDLAKGIGPLEKLGAGDDFESNTKIFCCILKSAIRKYLEDKNPNMDLFAELLHKIIERYRSIPVADKDRFFYSLGDEDMSLILESYCFPLLDSVPESKQDALLSILQNEKKHRQEKGMPIPKIGESNDKFLYRKSILKKYVSSVLYLNTTEDKEGKLSNTVFSGVAAGLAMVFATGLTYIAMLRFGDFTFAFFVTVVLGYVFKDRIKDSLKSYFKHKLGKNIFDHKTRIFSGKKVAGIIREGFDFEREDKVAVHVQLLRNKDHITEIENSWVGENVIRHTKKIILINSELKLKDYPITAINDISKINITHYLSKMGEPKRQLYLLDGNTVIKAEGERVYHVNIVMKFTSEEKIFYKRLRLVLNRAGIKAIEEVNSDQESLPTRDIQWRHLIKKLPVKVHLPEK